MTASEYKHNYSTNILDLNEDCLDEILKYLSLSETFNLLGSLCQNIDEIIYKRLSSVKSLTINLSKEKHNHFTTQQLEIIARYLKTLYINASYSLPSSLTLHYLQPFCDQGKLQSLTLHYIQFDENYQKYILKITAHLEYLDLSYCQLTDELLGPILEKCKQIKTLTIFGNSNLRCKSMRLLKSKDFKELKTEQNSNCKNEIDKFINENPHVTVTIFGIGYMGDIMNIL